MVGILKDAELLPKDRGVTAGMEQEMPLEYGAGLSENLLWITQASLHMSVPSDSKHGKHAMAI